MSTPELLESNSFFFLGGGGGEEKGRTLHFYPFWCTIIELDS